MTKLEQYELKYKELCECKSTRKYYKIVKELKALAIAINKENNCYYDCENWITEFVLANDKLTGNELTDYIANELNKLNGVMLERHIEDGKVNYSVSVVTPYKVYSYTLYRGYDNVCNLKPYKFDDGTNKTFTTDAIVEEHICELVFANCSKLEKLRTEYNRNILSKNKNNKPFELVKYEQKQEEQVVVTHRMLYDDFVRKEVSEYVK